VSLFTRANRTDRASKVQARASRRAVFWVGLMLLLIALSPMVVNLKAAPPPPPLLGFGPRTPLLQAGDLPPACANPGYTSLSKCIDKTGKNDVEIGANARNTFCKTNVVADEASYNLGQVTIGAGGLLLLPDQTAQVPVNIKTTGMSVTGTLKIGDPACPIGTTNPTTRVTITFSGKEKDCPNGCAGSVKGIQVEKNGSLIMYGLKGVTIPTVPPVPGVSWTYLSTPAGPTSYNSAAGVLSPVPAGGNTTLQLASDVTGPNG